MKLSKFANRKFRKINANKFNSYSDEIQDEIEKIQYDGLDYSEWEKKTMDENEKIQRDFLEFIQDKVSNKSLELYGFYSLHFLNEFRFTHGKNLNTLNEQILVAQLFDRFPRKVMMDKNEKLLALKAVKVMFQYFHQEKLVDANLYRFVKLLSKQEDFFKDRILNPASSLFLEVNQSWEESLHDFEFETLKLIYYVYGEFLEPKSYVGALEHQLLDILVDEQLGSWRDLRWKKGTKRSDLIINATNFAKKWYNSPKSYLNNLTPMDCILLERKFSNIKL